MDPTAAPRSAGWPYPLQGTTVYFSKKKIAALPVFFLNGGGVHAEGSLFHHRASLVCSYRTWCPKPPCWIWKCGQAGCGRARTRADFRARASGWESRARVLFAQVGPWPGPTGRPIQCAHRPIAHALPCRFWWARPYSQERGRPEFEAKLTYTVCYHSPLLPPPLAVPPPPRTNTTTD